MGSGFSFRHLGVVFCQRPTRMNDCIFEVIRGGAYGGTQIFCGGPCFMQHAGDARVSWEHLKQTDGVLPKTQKTSFKSVSSEGFPQLAHW